ncbi:MAG: hypothetical protein LBS63_00785 [Prevotellaceae bacterium]|jgi:hypothetical protein|nr:hypothetical protein [Prevotellaceae bacterium]
MNTDYIPARDSELVAWSANFIAQLTPHIFPWGINPQDFTNLQVAASGFATLHQQADSPEKTSVIVAQKNAARAALIALVRALVNFQLRNPAISDAERVALGLHVHDGTHSPVPVPTSRPELNIDVLDVRRLRVAFHDMGSAGKAKPYGVNGAVILYAVLDAPPTSPATLTRSVLATHTPFTLEFAEEERGRTVYVAICWQNEQGEKGPWSEIESAIIP